MKIQLFVCYHKPYFQWNSDIVTPIHVGKALSDLNLNMIGDNTGDNISSKNPYFCELTATYWIWKNVHTDYVGLFHYRRFLNFKTADTKTNQITSSFCEDYGIDKNHLENLLPKYDVILPKKTKQIKPSLYEYYADAHVINDLDLVLELINEKYPQMADVAVNILKNNSQGYFANILITKKSFFDEYATWLFDILFALEKKIQANVITRNSYQQRAYGFLAERMTRIFIEYKVKTANLKIKELPCLYIEDDKKKWKRYQRRQLKRKILKFFGFSKKKWEI